MSNWWIRSHRNLLFCLIWIILSLKWTTEASRGQAYLAIRGIEVSNACFGVDGLDRTTNKIHCNSDEKICIWDVDYGMKKVLPNMTCPHAAAHNVPEECCSPDIEDCVVKAGFRRKQDLIIECQYLSTTSCDLHVDRIDVEGSCTVRPGLTFTTFRSITYVCAPNALAEPDEDPCKFLPDPDSTFWLDLEERKSEREEAMRRMALAGSGEESATVLIASIIGFSVFLVVFILLMILAFRCTGWMVDPQDDVRKSSEREAAFSYGLHSVDYGWKPFHQTYNVYVPYPRYHEHKPKNTVFSSNNEAKANKRFYYQTKYQSSYTSDEASVKGLNPKKNQLQSSEGSRETSGRSSPPSYRSRIDSPTNRTDQSESECTAGSSRELCDHNRALSIQERFQKMFYGDYFAPRRFQL